MGGRAAFLARLFLCVRLGRYSVGVDVLDACLPAGKSNGFLRIHLVSTTSHSPRSTSAFRLGLVVRALADHCVKDYSLSSYSSMLCLVSSNVEGRFVMRSPQYDEVEISVCVLVCEQRSR